MQVAGGCNCNVSWEFLMFIFDLASSLVVLADSCGTLLVGRVRISRIIGETSFFNLLCPSLLFFSPTDRRSYGLLSGL